MKNYIQPGDHITVTLAADVSGGDFVQIGSIRGVAQGDGVTGDEMVLVRSGVFEMAKTSAQAWTVGAPIYATPAGVMTTASSGNTLVGTAVENAANPSGTGKVLLTGQV